MRWDQLKTFYHVAKFESLSKTGQYLNIAQSAVSRQIINLEYRAGHKLFKRLPRGLVLTKQGQIMFKNIEKMFQYYELARYQIQNEHIEPEGDLVVGANVGLVDTWLLNAIPDFLNLYPKLNLDIYSKDAPLDVESLEVHVALQPFRENQSELVQTPLTTWSRKLYASKDYLEKNGVPRTTSDLKNHKLIGFGPQKIHLFDNIDWHLKLNSSKGNASKPYLSVNSIRALFHFGNSGLGIISFSKESLLLNESNLVPVLPEVEGPNFDICIAYPIELKGNKKIEVLEKYLLSYVNDKQRQSTHQD
jgi:DNA-binding transcriptional LysR family regulator